VTSRAWEGAVAVPMPPWTITALAMASAMVIRGEIRLGRSGPRHGLPVSRRRPTMTSLTVSCAPAKPVTQLTSGFGT